MGQSHEIHWNTAPRARWDRLARRADAPLSQHWTYGAAFEASGATVDRAEIRRGGKTLGLAQIINRRFGGVVPYSLLSRGPVWLQPVPGDALGGIYDRLRQGPARPGRRLMLITPADGADAAPLGAAGLSPVMTPPTIAVLDLRDGPDAARRAMHQKWRNRLCAAERGMPHAIDTDPAHLPWILATERRQQIRRHYRNFPTGFFVGWERLDPGALDVRVLTVGRQPAAAIVTLLHGPSATYQIGWSGSAGRAMGAHHLLIWSLIEALCKRGVTRLDMGILDTERSPGLARFKLGAGARPVVLGAPHAGIRRSGVRQRRGTAPAGLADA